MSRASGWSAIGVALLFAAPAVAMRLSGAHFGVVLDTLLFGVAIVAAAFLLSWTAEAAEVDVAQGLAVAVVALIAVLPEYAVDMAFAWKAGTDPTYAPYAVANMTGANRLLVGAAWPLIFLIFWWRTKQSTLHVERPQALEVTALLIATLYSFTIPLKGSISLVDTVVLGAIFVVYVWIIARAPTEEPELLGPAKTLGSLPRTQRRVSLAVLFALAAVAVFAAAEPFAEGLIHSGTELGIDEFLLVQWVAPFASEAPEFLVAGILAYRLRASTAMRILLSSKVNQWTLLIGGLAIAFAVSSGGWAGMELDGRQREELWLTAAQSLFAVAILSSLSFSAKEAFALFALFATQFAIPTSEVRLAVTAAYLLGSLLILAMRMGQMRTLLQYAFATARDPHAHEAEEAEHAHAEVGPHPPRP